MKNNKIYLILIILLLAFSTLKVYASDTTSDLTPQSEKYNIAILGDIDAKTVSLPLFSIVVGFIDGINPCAMWILIFLITMIMPMKDRKKQWILGLTFIITSGVVYLLFLVSWLNLAVFLTKITLIRTIISIFAIIFGVPTVSGRSPAW